MFLTDVLAKHASERPKQQAIVFENRQLTYKELYENAQKIASYLRQQGYKKGDIVGLLLLNSDLFMTAYYGVQLAGCTVMPLNTKLTTSELSYIFNHSEAKVLFYDERLLSTIENTNYTFDVMQSKNELNALLAVQEIIPIDVQLAEQDTAVVLYTSGTTGQPKGVMLSHFNIVNAVQIWHEAIQIMPEDRSYISIPLFHCAGLHVVAANTLYAGATLVIEEMFIPDRALHTVAEQKITIFWGVPTMYAILLNKEAMAQYNFEHLRLLCYGSAPMPHELVKRLKEAFPDIAIQNLYGQTESSPGGTSLTNDAALERIGSVGKPLARTDIKIVDREDREVPHGEVGEICIRGPQIMKGYLKNPEETQYTIRNGWLYSGDLGRFDEDGYLYLVDRKKDLIIRGGENIYPKEIEEVLFQMPQILDAAVIGIPDEIYGELPKAYIALKEGQTLSTEAIIDFAKGKLAKYKIPVEIEFMQELPRNPSGKVLKHVLRERFVKESSPK